MKVLLDDFLKRKLIGFNNKDEIIIYLLSLHFNLDCEPICQKKIDALKFHKILDKNGNLKINLFNIINDKSYDDLYKKLRSLWISKKIRVGASKTILSKLNRWFKENPDYDEDDVYNAAQAYIQSFSGNYKYTRRLEYFIFKKQGKEETSDLLEWVENSYDDNQTEDPFAIML